MGKRYRQFIKDLRKDSRCTVTPDDIYMETDFFDNSKPVVYSVFPFSCLPPYIWLLA